MRLWSLHPKYLDAKGLVALWRESLLALKVLQGGTKGYRNHPQLLRFKATDNPVAALASYLKDICFEATQRGYNFDESKIPKLEFEKKIPLNSDQLNYELEHLKNKLKIRCPEKYKKLEKLKKPDFHPLFHLKQGAIEEWEHLQEHRE